MDRPARLTDLQVDLAGIFFSLDAARGYLIAGGAALLAWDLIDRPTEDLDLFTAAPTTSVTAAKDAFVHALHRSGYTVAVVNDGPTFCRMIVGHAGEETLVDLAIDSPPVSRPTVTVLGPTLAPRELAGRKLLALFGRAEARDFADVYLLAQRFGKDTLLDQATAIDAGFDSRVLAQMIRTIGRFEENEIPLPSAARHAARAFYSDWSAELTHA